MTKYTTVSSIELPAYLFVYDVLADPHLVSQLLYEDSSTQTITRLIDSKLWAACIKGFRRRFHAKSNTYGIVLTLEYTGYNRDEVWGAVVLVETQEELKKLLGIYDFEYEYWKLDYVEYPDGSVSEGYTIVPRSGEGSSDLPHCLYVAKLCAAANFWDRRVRGYKWKFFKNLYYKNGIPMLATSCRCYLTDYTGTETEIQCTCDTDGLSCKL